MGDPPLSVLARNQTKGLDSRSPMRPEVGEERRALENPEGQLAKKPEEGELAKKDAERAIENGQQKGPFKMS